MQVVVVTWRHLTTRERERGREGGGVVPGHTKRDKREDRQTDCTHTLLYTHLNTHTQRN